MDAALGAGSAAGGSARRPSRWLGVVGSAALVALAVAGCGGTSVKGSSAEQVIKGQLGGSVTVKCPKTITYKEGKKFTCSLASGAKTGKAVVTMGKKKGSKVPLNIQVS